MIFLTVFIGVFLGVHYYLYFSATKDFAISSKRRFWIRMFLLLSALSYVAARMLERRGIPMGYALRYGSVWMGLVSVSFSVFIIKDIVGLFLKKHRKQRTLISFLIVLVLSGYSLINGLSDPVVKNIKIGTEKIEEGCSIKIVHLSDLHIDSVFPVKKLERLIKKINSLNADVIVITGDLLDGSICDYRAFCGLLNDMRAKYGVYAVAGNHEYYVGIDVFLDVADRGGINVLRNETVVINREFQLAGVDDYAGRSRKPEIENLGKTLEGIDTGRYTVLLAHRPLFFKEAVEMGVDLQLSGHTHFGQLPPFDLFVILLNEYPYGLYKLGESYIYTTSGTSTWGPPMRLFSKSEIPVFEITGTKVRRINF